MSKTITSPVKKFPGTVTLYDPLTFPQVMRVQAGIDAAQKGDNSNIFALRYALLPGLLGCVEKWDIVGLGMPTPETFPATPAVSAARLVDWLTNEIMALVSEGDETESPNE